MMASVIVLLAGLRWHPIMGHGMIVMVGRHRRRGGKPIMRMLNSVCEVRGVVRHLGLSGKRRHHKHARDQSGDDASPSVKHVPSYSHLILPLPPYSLA